MLFNWTIAVVVAFCANSAMLVGEIARRALLTIDKGQIEAAKSMGFGKLGIFFNIAIPQAMYMAFPLYKSEFISMFKMATAAGFIVVMHSSAGDTFFLLTATALVYLATALATIFLFDWIYRRVK